MSGHYDVLDANGKQLVEGSKVVCGDGEPGVVLHIEDPDLDTHAWLEVKWPEFDEPERFYATPRWQDDTARCDLTGVA